MMTEGKIRYFGNDSTFEVLNRDHGAAGYHLTRGLDRLFQLGDRGPNNKSEDSDDEENDLNSNQDGRSGLLEQERIGQVTNELRLATDTDRFLRQLPNGTCRNQLRFFRSSGERLRATRNIEFFLRSSR